MPFPYVPAPPVAALSVEDASSSTGTVAWNELAGAFLAYMQIFARQICVTVVEGGAPPFWVGRPIESCFQAGLCPFFLVCAYVLIRCPGRLGRPYQRSQRDFFIFIENIVSAWRGCGYPDPWCYFGCYGDHPAASAMRCSSPPPVLPQGKKLKREHSKASQAGVSDGGDCPDFDMDAAADDSGWGDVRVYAFVCQ